MKSLILLVVVLAADSYVSAGFVTRNTKLGAITGLKERIGDTVYFKFLGKLNIFFTILTVGIRLTC